MVTFGQIPKICGEVQYDPAVSDDRRALSLDFTGFEIAVGSAKSGDSPFATRVFSLPIPLEGNSEYPEIEFIANGFAVTTKGGTATLVLSVNGQTIAADIPEDTEHSIVKPLKFSAVSAPECRLSVILVAGRDAKNKDAEVFLSAKSIEAEILPRPPQPQG